jgi:subtilisin family serine protease
MPWDLSGHGTFLSVIAAGIEGNGIGSAGICPRCSILPVRFMDEDGLGDTEDAIQAIRYAVDEGAKVINFSFAGEGYDQDLADAITYADQHDALVVVAASNDGLDNDKEEIYPAKFNLPNMITIAALTQKDKLWKDSNWGLKSVHIAAPGDDLMSLWLGNYEVGSGTSDAAALVSGSAGLLRSINPSLTGRQLKQILMSTARVVPALRSKIITGGTLDLLKAAQCARNTSLCL